MSAQHAGTEQDGATDRARQGLTLLVADDDADLRLYVKRCVLAEGGPVGEVLEAADGEAAIEVLRSRRPDVLACDVVMPRLGGLAVCETVRSDPELAGIPVLLFTGFASARSMVDRAHEVGADAVLIKPFNHQRLCRAIKELVELRLDGGRGDAEAEAEDRDAKTDQQGDES